MKSTVTDVEYLYKLLLKRNPPASDMVNEWVNGFPSLEVLVEQFLLSSEFKTAYANIFPPNQEASHISLKLLIEALANLHPKRELYQPIYGITMDYPGPVQRECVARCDTVVQALKSLNLQHLTVLDVGCNMGYITLKLSEEFARCVGMEVDPLLFLFCQELQRHLRRPNVDFVYENFFEVTDNYSQQFDVCLLFSVIHYLVAGKGLAFAKEWLRDLADKFDHIFIELSSAKDYSYMPIDPSEMLSGLDPESYEYLGDSEKNNRPIYLIKKNKLKEK
jgi:SAM-dependent methyltransferase